MVNIEQIASTLINNQIEYNSQDENLISSFEIDTKLDSTSYIEYSIIRVTIMFIIILYLVKLDLI